MARRNVDDLRDLLFAQMDRLATAQEEALDAELARAEGMVRVADRLIDTAKVEVRLAAVLERGGGEPSSNFIDLSNKRALPSPGDGEDDA